MSKSRKPAHAFYSPSASSRWLTCTASVTIDTSHIPRTTSEAAELGTAMHTCAEMILRGKLKPAAAKGKTFNDRKMTPAMIDDIVMPYVEFVRDRVTPKSQLYIEHKSVLNDKCWGTSDAVIVTPVDDHTVDVSVIDLKTGAFHKVSPVNNTQLMIYAAGVVEDVKLLHGDVRDVYLSIVQPPMNVYATHKVSAKKLGEFLEHVEDTILDIEAGDVQFSPSEDNCRWCPAASVCPKLEETAEIAAAEDFKKLKTIGQKSLADKMSMIPQLEIFIKSVKSEAEQRLLTGKKVPGYRLGQGNSRRQWKFKEETLHKRLDALKIPKTWRVSHALLTPNQLETTLREKGQNPEILAKLIEQKPGGPVVVSEDSSRADFNLDQAAAKDFDKF